MKNIIYTFYNILLDEINREKNNYYFYYMNDLYLFYLVENDINVVENIYIYLKNNNIESYEIIYNKDKKMFTQVDNKNYSLLKLKGILKYEIEFKEFKYYPIDKEPHNWGELWSERLDYYEIQLRELGYNYQTVLNSFGLFSGLAENAILYYNMSINSFDDEVIVGIVHNRINYPCYSIEYNNPLNLVIDYYIRDISEYIKAYIFSEDFNINNVFSIIDNIKLNNLTFNLFYSRILYPTFYFDVFDKIILEDGKDIDVIPIVDNMNIYFDVIKKLYLRYNFKYRMFNIEWISKLK